MDCMQCDEDTGRDPEDLFITPLLPDLVLSPCGSEDSQICNSPSSPGNFVTLSEQEERPINTAASKGTQCCSMKSVAVQCDSILLVTQGVQYESPLWVTQNVQCEPVSQVTLGVQCELVSQVSQDVQCEPILSVSQNVQYECPSPVQKLKEALLEGKHTQALEDKPDKSASVSNINNEPISSPSNLQQYSSDRHFVTGLSITLPPSQEELDVVTSSQTMCISSSSEDAHNTVVREVSDEFSVHCSSIDDKVNSNSKIVLSTSDVLRKMKGTKCIKKNSRKGLVICDKSIPSSRHDKSGREYLKPSGKCDKSDGEYTVEELLLEMSTNRKCAEGGEQDKVKCKRRQIAAQKVFDISERHVRDVLPSSQTSTGGLQFSSLVCERCSSPESIGEETCEELSEARSYCYRNILSKVKPKDPEDGSTSYQNVRSSRPMKRDGRKSFVTNYYSDSCKSLGQNRKKLCRGSSDTDVTPKFGGQLVPYSDSRSNSGSSDSEVPLKLSRRIGQKYRKQNTCASTRSHVQKGVKYRNKQTQEYPAKVQRTSGRLTRSNSGSGSVRERCTSDTDSSDSGTSESSGIRMKVMQSKQESSVKSGSINITKNNAVNAKSNSGSESIKHRPACLDIWTSDDDDDDYDISTMSKVSSYTTVSKGRSRPRAPYTKLERETILWSIIDHKCYKRVKGNAIWQRMEKVNVCPGRTWQSMKEHFIKKMLPQIDTFHLDPTITKKFVIMR